tara:strand:+ start:974 stop:1144 length:171 start_codon:yes stop_codon:yes gene_type:complete
MESYKIFDNYGKDLIFASYSQSKFRKKVRELESKGVVINGADSPIRPLVCFTNVKP